MGVNFKMCGFQSGGSARLRDRVLGSFGNGLDRKEEASSATGMDENMLFHASRFVPSFSKEGRAKSKVRDHEAKTKSL